MPTGTACRHREGRFGSTPSNTSRSGQPIYPGAIGQKASPTRVPAQFSRPCESKCCALENAGAWGEGFYCWGSSPHFSGTAGVAIHGKAWCDEAGPG
jgi:hypothetical protein